MSNEGKFGAKTDMDRIGVFKEMEYISISDKYKSDNRVQFNAAASKGKQMLPGGSKERSARQDGYFKDKYTRVYEGEAYTDPIKLRRQHRLKELNKNIGKPFLPSSGDKKPVGLGNHYGTLSGPISAFSPVGKPGKGYKANGKNFYTNPGKHGTGFGYVSVTIGTYQKHQPDEYDRIKTLTIKENEAHKKALKGGAFKLNMAPKSLFDDNPYRTDKSFPSKKDGESKRDVKPFKPSSPGKKPGGMKAGTFKPYPTHSADPYIRKMQRSVNITNKTGKTFVPSAGPKSAPVSSIVNYNVVKAVNNQNYRTLNAVMSY